MAMTMTMAQMVDTSNTEAGPSRLAIATIPFSLDLSCPLPLPARPIVGYPWPYSIAGPSISPIESPQQCVKRRYLETLYLSDTLAPIPHLIHDVLRITPTTIGPNTSTNLKALPLSHLIAPLLLTLPQIEARHRKTLLPLYTSLLSASTHPSSDIRSSLVQDASTSSRLTQEETGVIRVALELRGGCRSIEGDVVHAKRLSEELEKRETLIQMALLLLYVMHSPPTLPPKKRKRDRKSKPAVELSCPTDDSSACVEVLMDRLGVWSAVAELGLGMDEDVHERKGQGRNGIGILGVIKDFWQSVIVPFFIDGQPDLCASFHLKVFGQPITPPLSNEPTTATKKARKPKLTHPRPSSDTLTQPPEPIRAASSAPSETATSRASPVRERDASMGRTLSRASTILTNVDLRRSRSRSVDPHPGRVDKDNLAFAEPKKGLGRAPSGKDLFKGRQVGLMRRSTSTTVRRDGRSQSQSQSFGRNDSQTRLGLLGRKTSGTSDSLKARRDSHESQSQNARSSGTLIFATPSKPRFVNSIFGHRTTSFVAPTPIQEEPLSGEPTVARPSFVTETPIAPGRIGLFAASESGGSGMDETPALGVTSTNGRVIDYPINEMGKAMDRGMSVMAGMCSAVEDLQGDDDSDDPLGDLMVMTDDEDEDERVGSSSGVVPETPAR